MTSIDKLQIHGYTLPPTHSPCAAPLAPPLIGLPLAAGRIRSFSPNEPQVIEFYKPLTLCAARTAPAPTPPRPTAPIAHARSFLSARAGYPRAGGTAARPCARPAAPAGARYG